MNLEANPASGIKKQVYDVINHMNMMYRKQIYVEREGGGRAQHKIKTCVKDYLENVKEKSKWK